MNNRRVHGLLVLELEGRQIAKCGVNPLAIVDIFQEEANLVVGVIVSTIVVAASGTVERAADGLDRISVSQHGYHGPFLLDGELKMLEAIESRLYTYGNQKMIVLFVIFQMRRIWRFKAQHRWLQQHPEMMEILKWRRIPHRTTLSRR